MKTKFENITESIDTLATFIDSITSCCSDCAVYKDCKDSKYQSSDCIGTIKEWLEQPVEVTND